MATVWFELTAPGTEWDGARLLAWITMPWTLVPNLAVVVGRDIDYSMLELDGHRYVLASARVDA